MVHINFEVRTHFNCWCSLMFQTAQLLLAEPDLYDETVIASRKLADAGNKAAKNNNYHGAIRMYSEAINTYPFDHRCVHLYMYA